MTNTVVTFYVHWATKRNGLSTVAGRGGAADREIETFARWTRVAGSELLYIGLWKKRRRNVMEE